MFSLLTSLFSSLTLPLSTSQHCQCPQPLYPNISSNLEKSCQSCGGLKPLEDPKPNISPSRTTSPPVNKPRSPTESKKVQYLNRKLTASLAAISDKPVPLICRNGSLAVFQNGETLYSYQARDVQRMLDRELQGLSTILAYAMGLGKTVTAAALVCENRAFKPGTFPTTLVIAPSVGILQHWAAELKRFAPNLRVLLYHGDGKKQDPRRPDIVLLTLWELRNQYASYSNKDAWDEQKFPLYTGTFHRVIIDEAQAIRNPDSASAKASWALKKTHALCLTGTPAQNTLRDIFPLLKFLDVKTKGLNHLGTFDALVTNPYKQGEIVKTTELLVAVLSDCMIYRPKNSALGAVQLPKLHIPVLVHVELTPAERDVYRYINSVHPFKSQWAKMIRLRQAVDHPALLTKALHRGDIGPKPDETSDQMRILLDETPAEASEVISQDIPLATLPPALQAHAAIFALRYQSSKFKAVWKILRSVPQGEKVIIFSHFLTNLDIMAGSLSENNISYTRYDGRMSSSERADALLQIRTEKTCTVLLLSIMAGGTGLDIPACNHVVLMEPWWNPYVEEQAISRVHRIGQRREVRVYRLLVKNSIEDSIVKTQDAKREVIGGLLSLCTVPDVDEMRKWLA
ncbi:P-loop containing nucleoside triphosphate hydrolase protein [Mycena galericulata]|nr:P-loop containing nucleoside triphosphate hydrolase protein [Mycena galericulata]